MNIYLAGKIYKNCWRHSLVKNLRERFLGSCGDSVGIEEKYWPIMLNALGDGLNYCGPYFVSCDHGCFHEDGAAHGVVASYDRLNHDPACYLDDAYGNAFSRCLDAIENSDCVFCWIDSYDCFGTIAEIGYARALGKFICIAVKEGFDDDDLWFVRSMAHRTLRSTDAQSAFCDFRKLHLTSGNYGVRFSF